MASIVERGKSFCVVYYTTMGGVRKQMWETYHSLEEARQRKELLELYLRQKKILEVKSVENVEQLMAQYIRLSEGNIKAVQGDSGHAQAQMITETYGHILDQNRRETSDRFEQRFYRK